MEAGYRELRGKTQSRWWVTGWYKEAIYHQESEEMQIEALKEHEELKEIPQ